MRGETDPLRRLYKCDFTYRAWTPSDAVPADPVNKAMASSARTQRSAKAIPDPSAGERLLVVVAGARGVGKTTVLRLLHEQRPEITLVLMSECLEALAAELLGKDLERSSIQERHSLRAELGRRLARGLRSSEGIILFDTHLTDYREDAFRVIHDPEWLYALDVVLLLDAPARVIRVRRAADPSRDREVDIAQIESERESERRALAEVGRCYGGKTAVIDASRTPDSVAMAIDGAILAAYEAAAPQRSAGTSGGSSEIRHPRD
jgi:adenylate kinase